MKGNTFRFMDFELDGTKRVLFRNGKPLTLNPKAFDILFVLVESRGEILTKDELLERVWPDQFVEEGNLKVHISAIRKIFGERANEHRFIATVPGRGYSFVADVDQSNHCVVTETHSLSRIVVDKHVSHNDGAISSTSQLAQPSKQSVSITTRLVACLVGSVAITALYFIFRPNPSANAGFADMQIKRLTTNGVVSFAALSPDGKMFAYVKKELEQNSLWMGFVDGGNDVQLRPSETGRYNDLAFSSDGTTILFTFSGADSRESVLYRMPAFGGAREKIRSNIRSFNVCPDGKRYAFARTDTATKMRQIVIGQLDGSEERELNLFPETRSLGVESISWSPDGGSIAIGAGFEDEKSGDEVFTVNVTDGSMRQISNHGWKEIIKTAWVDGGSAVLIVAEDRNSHTSVSYSQIWRVSLTDGEAKQLTNDLSSYRSVLNATDDTLLTVELRQTNNIWVAPSNDLAAIRQVTFGTFGRYDGLWGLDWTADGKIVFTSTDHRSQVISLMDADGGNVKQLTSPGFNDSYVNASNDGRYIVFQSSRAGGSDIWRMNADGTNVVRITSDGKSYQPFVSPDNRFVYYRSFAENVGEMRRVPLDGGEPTKLTDVEVAYLSVSPDGTRIAAAAGTRLAIFPADGGPAEKYFELSRFGRLSANTRWSPDGKAIAYRDMGHGFWMQPVDGGEPRRMEGLPMEKFYNFAWSKDGKQFAFIRGLEIRDAVLFRKNK